MLRSLLLFFYTHTHKQFLTAVWCWQNASRNQPLHHVVQTHTHTYTQALRTHSRLHSVPPHLLSHSPTLVWQLWSSLPAMSRRQKAFNTEVCNIHKECSTYSAIDVGELEREQHWSGLLVMWSNIILMAVVWDRIYPVVHSAPFLAYNQFPRCNT